MRLRAVDYLMGIAVPLVWGMGIVFAKTAITHFPPILLMTFRFAVTALVLVWFVKFPRGHLKPIFLITLISAAIQYSLTFTGLKNLDASIAALVVQLEVPFLVLIGVFALKETASWQKWFGIALAFCGVGLIAGAPQLGGAWLSLLMLVGGALSWAIGQALVRRLQDVSGLSMTAWVAVCAVPQLLIMSLIFESNHLQAIETASWQVWATVAYLGIVMTAFGYGIWYTLVRRHPISVVGPFLLLLPVFSVIGAVLFLGERLTTETIFGGIVVITGVGLITLDERRSKPAPRITEGTEQT